METEVKVRFRLDVHTGRWDWRPMCGADGHALPLSNTLAECKNERRKAIRRHKPYGRDYAYRIVRVTEEVVA